MAKMLWKILQKYYRFLISASVAHHSYCTIYQVQQWQGNKLGTQQWGQNNCWLFLWAILKLILYLQRKLFYFFMIPCENWWEVFFYGKKFESEGLQKQLYGNTATLEFEDSTSMLLEDIDRDLDNRNSLENEDI